MNSLSIKGSGGAIPWGELPTTKNEQYRKIDIKSVFEKALNNSLLNSESCCEDSSFGDVVVMDIMSFADRYPEVLTKYLSKSLTHGAVEQAIGTRFKSRRDSRSVLVDLNSEFLSCGVVVYIPKRSVTKQTIEIILDHKDIVLGRRDMIIAESLSSANIVYKNTSKHSLLNRVCEVYIDNGASLEIVDINVSSADGATVSSTLIEQSANSSLRHFSVTSSRAVVRNNIKSSLCGPGASCDLYGVSFVDHSGVVSNCSVVEHLEANCTSNEHYKSVVTGQAVADFSGTIFVNEDAQRTSAMQRNDNILLTDTAKAHTKPQLEIYADDVKCSHGATVGQLNAEALFYMMQRGISREEGQRLLLTGFLNDVLMKISDEKIKESVIAEVNNAL